MSQHPQVDTMMAADRASRALGLELVEVAPGRAVVRMTVAADHLNGYGTMHGGLLFSLADTAFACACNSGTTKAVAAGAEIVFVAPAHAGDELVAEAVVRTEFGRHGVYDVTVRRAGGEGTGGQVVAEFRGRSAAVRG